VSYTVVPGGTATGCSISGATLTATSAGTCFVTATKAASTGYSATTSAQVTETFTGSALGKTTLTLLPENPIPVTAGSSAIYLAYVNGGSETSPLTGTVTFYVGGVAVPGCSNEHLVLGLALCVIHFPNAGSLTVTATYGNDPKNSTSTDSSTQVVNKGTTSLTLSPSTPVLSGTSVQYSATLVETSGSGLLSGTVSFTENGAVIAGCQNLTLVGGKASCTVHFTSTGTYTIAASYASDANFTGSNASIAQAVGTKPAITSANSTNARVGHSFSFQVVATGSPTPTFSYSGTLPHGVTFNTSTGVLSGTPSNGSQGNYTITVTATNSLGSTSQMLKLSVTN
jgi:hypothetical protein